MSLYASYKQAVKDRFPHLPDSDECGERMGVLEHLDPRARVLEIGANRGGVSSLIAAILHDSNNLVAVEPIASTCEGLQQLGNSLRTPFRTFAGVVKGAGKPDVDCTGEKNSYARCVPCECPATENLTIDELEKRFDIEFTALVVDCEGCFTSFLPDALQKRSIVQINIEWDGPFMEKEILDAGFVHVATYQHCGLPNGVRVYNRPN